jgi:glucokinase
VLIAGDIGGTKTLLAIYDAAHGSREPIVQMEYPSARYTALDVMVREFLMSTRAKVRAACFDVAGPVIRGRAQLTNLPWTVDAASLRTSLRLEEVFLLNDLTATAYAVPHLRIGDLHTLNAGVADPDGSVAVVAPGTGLGEAFLVRSNGGYLACSSEGGHASFSANDETQTALWRYLNRKFGHVSAERVCSGPGIANIYDFLLSVDPSAEPASFARQLVGETDRTPLIVRAGLVEPPENPVAAAAIGLFVAALAEESSNLALKVLSTGGVYLAGGIPPRILPRLIDGQFMRAFANKGRFEDMLARLPVHVIVTQAALLGAAQYGLDMLARLQNNDRSQQRGQV